MVPQPNEPRPANTHGTIDNRFQEFLREETLAGHLHLVGSGSGQAAMLEVPA